MIRRLIAAALALSFAAVAAAQDTIYYYDRAQKKVVDVVGPIEEESPAGVKGKFRVKGEKDAKEMTIPAGDITKILYFVGKGNDREFRSPINRIEDVPKLTAATRKVQIEKALGDYKKLEPTVKGYPNARRYIEFKTAEATVLLAQDDPTKQEAAVKLLTQFKTDNPNSWTIVPALKTLAKLLEDSGKPDEASKVYEELARVPSIPDDLKKESRLLVGRLLLRGGKFADAQKQLQALTDTMPSNDPQKPFVTAYLAESKMGQGKTDGVDKELESAIKGNSDARLRGLAYNLLGDLHRKSGRLEDAFWAYMRVEALYNDDAEQQAKALFYLGGKDGLFDKVKKDPARGRDCHRRLADARFAGTPYPKQVTQEKDDTEPDEPMETLPKKDKDVKKDRDAKKDKGKN